MDVVHIIISVKSYLEYQVMAYMFLGYEQNHTGGKSHVINICTKFIILRRDVIWLSKNYG